MKHLHYRPDMKHSACAPYGEKIKKMRVFQFVTQTYPHYIIDRSTKSRLGGTQSATGGRSRSQKASGISAKTYRRRAIVCK